MIENWLTIILGLITAISTITTVMVNWVGRVKIKQLELEKLEKEEVSKRKEREVEIKAREAEAKAAELIVMKKDMNALYSKWKEVADEYKEEKNILKKQLEEKCAECVSLQIQLSEKSHV